ncbi:hypothetical protein BLNAU_2385 [Blattamonas nauphoetae]|uniref:Uncharacterized protein n=1 Tax=Blattamonas nauphoetae TaxID=2049346 RepID=A0ABQ9YFK8_9EUKA|nr:hypothetical protein BLNAU_2385 [Blattamonas nauphoetae]
MGMEEFEKREKRTTRDGNMKWSLRRIWMKREEDMKMKNEDERMRQVKEVKENKLQAEKMKNQQKVNPSDSSKTDPSVSPALAVVEWPTTNLLDRKNEYKPTTPHPPKNTFVLQALDEMWKQRINAEKQLSRDKLHKGLLAEQDRQMGRDKQRPKSARPKRPSKMSRRRRPRQEEEKNKM